MDENEPPCVSPAPPRNLTSSLLSDISNFKTPRRSSVVNSNFSKSPYPHFFTASKQTPKSSSSNFRRPSMVPSYTSRSKVSTSSRRLKAFELQQSQSSRKAELTKEKSLRSLAKSLTVWLNFLFENPVNCGCDPFENDSGVGNLGKGKRDSGEALGNSKSVGVDTMWRSPKRLRNLGWCGEKKGSEIGSSLTGSKYSTLRESLRDVCSLDDLKQRMQFHLSLGSCKEIFDVMTRVTKNIDEGRIKMKSQCPLVTDFGMKEKAIKALMCYNQVWLRLGLYIIFGGDSFLSDSEVNSDQEMAFLKMVINKQFFSHDGLARAYAYNKMVEGLYRPGYYEALGNVILKRILLLVLVIDRAKSQSCLSLKYGIDGIDGGSPLMFSEKSSIKSSHQLICVFLLFFMFTAANFPFSALNIELLSSDVMHGEGNLLAHLVIIGYKIPYQQFDLMRLLIKQKMVVPSDNRKKNLVNCRIALQYLRDAGVSLKDDEGMMITGEDVADGDRELTISLLWNIFVHLQLPLLINGRLLTEEIYKVQGLEQNNQITMSTPPLEMLLNWIQDSGGEQGPQSVMSNTDYHDAVQNFILSQKLTALLGSFPEIGDLLEHNAVVSNQSVIILLAFLSSKLIVKENLVGYLTNSVFSQEKLNFHKLLCSSCQAQEKRYSRISCSSSEAVTNEEPDRENGEDTTKSFQAIKAWWQDMANQNQNSVGKASNDTLQSSLSSKCTTDSQRAYLLLTEIAAVVIQSNIKGLHARRKFRKKMRAICFLQASVRTWLSVKNIQVLEKLNVEEVTLHLSERSANLKPVARYVKFIVERSRFIKLRKSVSVIQKAVRRHQSNLHHELKAALKIQLAWRSYKEKVISSITIQSYVRGWITRRTNWTYKFSSILIQLTFSSFIYPYISQSHWRGYLTRKASKAQVLDLRVRMQTSAANIDDKKRLINKLLSALSELLSMKNVHNILHETLSGSVVYGYYLFWEGSFRSAPSLTSGLWRESITPAMSLESLRSSKEGPLVIAGAWRWCRCCRIPPGADLRFESATKYSDKCCEEIVAAGAIDKLLTLIRSASRSIPDQQVSKHALSTLGHLARYPHMADELIDTKGSIQTIFWELLRSSFSSQVFSSRLKNKEEAYFIASDVLKKICSSHKGVEAVRKLPALVKRLHALVEELTRKANIEKRNVKGQTGKEKSERRLKEAIELLKLITRR
ncbi:hypothetical protein ARALYDRAFT_492692 [Arabidopsis lyrata subsp. lyrata]|uniref:Binding protein n=1 Tax=Arabidopsis lyrata subsp. lyrata TaxID=81972 RepID=D7MEN8_ARALL|nr:hypothetical protein ARALYDRAFT_492692 [Arabidopsis lyrata subsp. lyrata]